MSSSFYDELWRSNQIKLRGLLDCELEASSNDKKHPESEWARMYNAYLDIASSLAGAHTGLVQPQKLELVAQCLQACLGRAVEIRQHLVDLKGGLPGIDIPRGPGSGIPAFVCLLPPHSQSEQGELTIPQCAVRPWASERIACRKPADRATLTGSSEADAAIRIQAVARGFLVRRRRRLGQGLRSLLIGPSCSAATATVAAAEAERKKIRSMMQADLERTMREVQERKVSQEGPLWQQAILHELQGLQASKRAVDDVRTLLPDQHQAFISAHLMHLAPKSLPVSLEPGTPEAPRAWRGPERPSRPGQGGSGAPPGGPPAAGARGAVGTPPRSGSTAPATASKKDRRGSPIQPRESVCLAVLKRVCSATEHLWQQLEGEPGAPSMPGATLLDAGMEGLAPPFVSWERDGLCLAVLEKEAGRRAWLAVCMRTLQDFRDGDPADHGDSCVAKKTNGRKAGAGPRKASMAQASKKSRKKWAHGNKALGPVMDQTQGLPGLDAMAAQLVELGLMYNPPPTSLDAYCPVHETGPPEPPRHGGAAADSAPAAGGKASNVARSTRQGSHGPQDATHADVSMPGVKHALLMLGTLPLALPNLRTG
ncbi:DRC11 [Auxenochlorella protothecoides x Auxenochlorella symbiontica]